jgi:histidine triad (HIT) family protein
MASIFTKIINGEMPCYKVAEDEKFIAFLDIDPNAKGHTLCVPKIEIDKFFDLDEDTYLELMKFSRIVAMALKKTHSLQSHWCFCYRVGSASCTRSSYSS